MDPLAELEGPRRADQFSHVRSLQENLGFQRRAEQQQSTPKVFKLVGKSASEVGALATEVSHERLDAETLPSWAEVKGHCY